ncbi:putative transcriptional regulator [Nostocoides australiense Ben110]|uniref:Putative transcriptional regulator n=2 Tax=Nostocoides australiense TaxID=99480 RepID=W6JXG6_9MICO|nr:putative transcriptional regulator [Tetrasphaera australiensis Ben110]
MLGPMTDRVRTRELHARTYDVAAIPLTDDVTETALRLMEAAADAFADRGFHATTTRDIAGRAGLSPAGVYVHFASKEELLFSICERGHTAARDMLVAAQAGASTPTEALFAIMVNFSRWHAEQYRVGRIVQYEFGHLTTEHRDAVMGLRKQIDAVVRSVLTDGVTAGEFRVEDVPHTALALLSLCIDVARWYEPGIKRSPQEIGEINGELGLRLVGAR